MYDCKHFMETEYIEENVFLGRNMAYTVYLDAGHGGFDSGAVDGNRREKDDALDLTLAVGEILQQNGVDVGYTRVEDVYDSPSRKAQIANQAGADLFVSFHRNAAEYRNQYNGVQTLIFDNSGIKKEMADAINAALSEVGFKNIGTETRRNLAVLRQTKMPALLVEAGFIDSDIDNGIYDEEFDAMAKAIAYAIIDTLQNNGLITSNDMRQMAASEKQEKSQEEHVVGTMVNGTCICNDIPEDSMPQPTYMIQTGLYRNYANALRQRLKMERDGYPAMIQMYRQYFAVVNGYYDNLKEAQEVEQKMRAKGYDTLIRTVK